MLLCFLALSNCTYYRYSRTYLVHEVESGDRLSIIISDNLSTPSQSCAIGVPPLRLLLGKDNIYPDKIKSNRGYINDVVVAYKTDNSVYELSLPPKVKYNLINYLHQIPKTKGPFNCESFAFFLHDINPTCVKEIYWEFFKSEEEIKPGDIIGIFTDKYLKKQLHYAIYLGRGFFISKFGITSVRITSLEKMLLFYPGRVYIAAQINDKQGKILYLR